MIRPEIIEIMMQRKPINGRVGPRRLLYGVGTNDADFLIYKAENGKLDKSYQSWVNMIGRCYDPKFLKRRPSYSDCTVCPDWLMFSMFDKWFLANYINGYHLDKDLLFAGNKIYSPDTCIFVPRWLNTFVEVCNSARGEYPLGASYHKRDKNFRSSCSHPFAGNEYLGNFKTPEEAHEAWLNRKLEIALELKPLIDEVDARLYECVVAKIYSLK